MEASADAPVPVAAGMHPSDMVALLEASMREFEEAGQYEEATRIKNQLSGMRLEEQNRRRDQIRAEQLAEKLGIEEAHMKELQEFNDIWDRKVQEFELHANALCQQLGERHRLEFMAYSEKLHKETAPRTPRWSKELLTLRKVEATLVKQKNYAEASKIKAQVGNGLRKRVQSGREESRQARKAELERLLQRYHNVKVAMETQHHLRRIDHERYARTASGAPPLSPQQPQAQMVSKGSASGRPTTPLSALTSVQSGLRVSISF
uniref:UVR domain-containing protein n=1 Tax=Chromera velia CCMP2878 TaxID=1169474 RepID=A0A0G4FGD8_9ALVE|eukprot:Cvel_16863.t1-p1 / transcript=Cvel_16863.t1 / gene=Cvel_16863 / organism=Chromera_velia_CCMP2878 / gene_product=hypothetical protein / transcript_product=hypothetical protein / location=Cvel_scaffold1319:2004-6460(+) / protein_length=262 / sequence_SO=supercontig / SO=protein_coding / is_pseudo=false